MPKRMRWVILALVFLAGLLLGFLASVLGADLGLVALYEESGVWAVLARLGVILFIVAVPIGYIIWHIAGAAELARATDQVQGPLHYNQRGEWSSVRRVLVSTRGGSHASFGLHLATRIAHAADGDVTLFRVMPEADEADVEEGERDLERMAETVSGSEVPVQGRISTNSSVVEAILEEANRGEYDLLVVGASDEGTVQNLLFGAIPQALAERTPCPILIVRGAGG